MNAPIPQPTEWERVQDRFQDAAVDTVANPEKTQRQIFASLSIAASNMCVADQLKRVNDSLQEMIRGDGLRVTGSIRTWEDE